MSEMVFLNGRLLPRHQATIPVLDYGFLYGYGLFETLRAYGGRVFRLANHIERLKNSAVVLGLSLPEVDWDSAVRDTVRANHLTEARIRITVSGGEGGLTPDPATCKQPAVLITAAKYTPYPEEVYRRGFRAIISSIRRNSRSPLSRLKSTSYLESLLVKQAARSDGVDEAICLNERGLLAEASMSNIFLVNNGVLKTPGENSGILPGVTRDLVLEMAVASGIKTRQRNIRQAELFQAQEAFLTNSLMEIMPLTVVDGQPIGTGRVGPVTINLMSAYKEMVLAETG